MAKQSNLIQDSQSKAIANVQRQQTETATGIHISDNRPEAIMQRKLQALANTNIQAAQLKALHTSQEGKPIQKQSDSEEETLQGKFETIQRAESEEEDLLQGKFTQASAIQLQADAPNNTGLPDQLKAGIESLGGMTMDHVKVHYNSDKPAQLNAHAYAQGSNIHVAPGQEKHLGHEAWHVVQQAQGRVKPTMQMKQGIPVNDDAGLEHEADVMGAKALTMPAQLVSNDLLSSTSNQSETTESLLQGKFGKVFQLKPCAKHKYTGSKPCPHCKVEKSNKKHNPKAGVAGGGAAASASVDRDAYAMANMDGKKSRKELNREFKSKKDD